MTFYSQITTKADKWVSEHLPESTGTFLDVGAGDWKKISNTLYFEELGWWGIAIDKDPKFAMGWTINRPRSKFFVLDATVIDYELFLKDMPQTIDFLTIDLEPPQLAWPVLQKVITSGHAFRAVTFEHDSYRGTGTKEPSREFMKKHGYKWMACCNEQDDFYLLDTESCKV